MKEKEGTLPEIILAIIITIVALALVIPVIALIVIAAMILAMVILFEMLFLAIKIKVMGETRTDSARTTQERNAPRLTVVESIRKEEIIDPHNRYNGKEKKR